MVPCGKGDNGIPHLEEGSKGVFRIEEGTTYVVAQLEESSRGQRSAHLVEVTNGCTVGRGDKGAPIVREDKEVFNLEEETKRYPV